MRGFDSCYPCLFFKSKEIQFTRRLQPRKVSRKLAAVKLTVRQAARLNISQVFRSEPSLGLTFNKPNVRFGAKLHMPFRVRLKLVKVRRRLIGSGDWSTLGMPRRLCIPFNRALSWRSTSSHRRNFFTARKALFSRYQSLRWRMKSRTPLKTFSKRSNSRNQAWIKASRRFDQWKWVKRHRRTKWQAERVYYLPIAARRLKNKLKFFKRQKSRRPFTARAQLAGNLRRPFPYSLPKRYVTQVPSEIGFLFKKANYTLTGRLGFKPCVTLEASSISSVYTWCGDFLLTVIQSYLKQFLLTSNTVLLNNVLPNLSWANSSLRFNLFSDSRSRLNLYTRSLPNLRQSITATSNLAAPEISLRERAFRGLRHAFTRRRTKVSARARFGNRLFRVRVRHKWRFRERRFKWAPKRFKYRNRRRKAKRFELIARRLLSLRACARVRSSLPGIGLRVGFPSLPQGLFSKTTLLNSNSIRLCVKDLDYRMYPTDVKDFLKSRILHIGRLDLPIKKSTVYLDSTKSSSINFPSLVSALSTDKLRESCLEVLASRSGDSAALSPLSFFGWADSNILKYLTSASTTLERPGASSALTAVSKKPYTIKYKRGNFRISRRSQILHSIKRYPEGLTHFTKKSFSSLDGVDGSHTFPPHSTLNSLNPHSFLALYAARFNPTAIKFFTRHWLNESSNGRSKVNNLSLLENTLAGICFNDRAGIRKVSNLTPLSFFTATVKRRVFKMVTFNKFSLNVNLWYYHTLVKFMEATSGHKVFIKFNPFILNALTYPDIARSHSWSQRLGGFQRILGPKFFLLESLKVMHLAIRAKDPTFFANWIKGMLDRMGFWKYRLFFRFFRYVMRYFFYGKFDELGFKGIKLRLKGKVSVAGNARSRAIVFRLGDTSHAKFDNRVVHDYSIMNTFTGVLGFQVWLFF